MTVQYYDFEDKPIKRANYAKKPSREFSKEEKYYKEGSEKTDNPDFDLTYAKTLRNKLIEDKRKKAYPPPLELADAIYYEKKGDSLKITKYITDRDKVNTDLPLVT